MTHTKIALLFDDNTVFAETVRTSLGKYGWMVETPELSGELKCFAERAAASVAESPSLFLINAELKFNGSHRVEFQGIEVLKWLRMSRLPYHLQMRLPAFSSTFAVMYSFRSFESLLRKHRSNRILYSTGTRFARAPLDFEAVLQVINRHQNELPDLTELRSWVRGDLPILDHRHHWANWFAGWQLLKIHRNVCDKPDLGVSTLTGRESSPAVRDVLFAFGAEEFADDPDGGERFRKRALLAQQRITTQTQSAPIAVIDDQANELLSGGSCGWTRIYSLILLNSETGVLDALNSGTPNYDALEDCSCVLLDLRLRSGDATRSPEQSHGLTVLAQIRDRYRALPIIVTTAADKAGSVKAAMRAGADAYWVKKGPDSFDGTPQDFLALKNNYEELLSLVERATGPEYQFLLKWHSCAEKITAKRTQWWIDDGELETIWPGFLGPKDPGPSALRSSVRTALRDISHMLREHLRRSVMRSDYSVGVTDTFAFAAIALEIGKIIEIVHRFPSLPPHKRRDARTNIIGGKWKDGKLVKKKGRCDWAAYYLSGIRNSFAHASEAPASVERWEPLKKALVGLLCYLEIGPRPEYYAGGAVGQYPPACDDPVTSGYEMLCANHDAARFAAGLMA